MSVESINISRKVEYVLPILCLENEYGVAAAESWFLIFSKLNVLNLKNLSNIS